MLINLPWNLRENKIMSFEIDDEESINKLREWVISRNIYKSTTTHIWYKDLPANISMLYSKIILNKKIINGLREISNYNDNIDLLNDMNEIYITSPVTKKDSMTSDSIFYIKHIDGPYYLMPFATCYRMIIGLDNNTNVSTCFPMNNKTTKVKKGDVVLFDYNRDTHYIYTDSDESEELRVVLKVHYCIYPKWALYIGKLLGYLCISYNERARNLFLYTLITNDKLKKHIAYIMVMATKLYYYIEYYIGYNNISYIGLLYFFTNNITFMYATSFIHYLLALNNKNDKLSMEYIRNYRTFYLVYSLQLYYKYYAYVNTNTILMSQFTNILMYLMDYSKFIKINELITLTLLYDINNLKNYFNIFISLHFIMNALEYKMS
jgi:hypothetical protein